MPWLIDFALLAGSYALGSLPFAVWVTYLFKGTDVRAAGSGHAGATNTLRQAGWLAGLVVLVLDVGKGALPVYLAVEIGHSQWVVPLGAALAVVGHCWPVWADFKGGMGLATAGGAVLAVSPLGFFLGLGVLISFVLILRHAARASMISGFLLAPVYYLFGLGQTTVLVGLAVGIVIILRFRQDWHRQYRELWLDREPQE